MQHILLCLINQGSLFLADKATAQLLFANPCPPALLCITVAIQCVQCPLQKLLKRPSQQENDP